MANRLKMARVQSILSLHAQGWSRRRISRELDIDRETVSRYVQLDQQSAAKRELDPGAISKPANAPIPGPGSSALVEPPIPPIESPGSGRRSDCEPWREVIAAKRDQGLSARRIYQDLASEHSAPVSYDSVRRFMRRLGWARPLPFRRLECAPGQEAQVDFGKGAPIVGRDGKRRRTHVFRIVLSHSRKAYSEATYRQTTEDFLGALENAFHHFGGVIQTLIIDNLKAAVKHPDWFDPELVPKVAAFCRHYGIVILPTKPYMPRHKGKVERGVDYVQENGLKGRQFESLQEQNRHLAHWETNVADTRIHGTTRKHVGRVFREVEQPALRPLPAERFPSFQEAQRSVNRDGHVEVAKAYYSAPPEYLGRRVWVRWDARTVRIFNHRFEQVALHLRHEPGRFSTLGEHLAPEKISSIERGAEWLLVKIRGIGPHTGEWACAMLRARRRRCACAARTVGAGQALRGRRHRARLRDSDLVWSVPPPTGAATHCSTGGQATVTSLVGRASDHSATGRLWPVACGRARRARGKEPAGPPGSSPRTPILLPLFPVPLTPIYRRR